MHRSAAVPIALASLALAGCGRDVATPIVPSPAPRAAPRDADAAAENPGRSVSEVPPDTPDPTLEALYASFEPPTRGDPDAPVLLYVFSDYLCPYCRRFATEAAREVEREYIAEGSLALVFIDFPLPSHGYPSFAGHEAAHCAGEQGRFWEMHDALFESQDRLAAIDVEDEAASQAAVVDIGASVGLDAVALRACVLSERYRPILASLYQQARERGVDATPTLLLRSEEHTESVSGYLPFDELQPLIERELARARGPASGLP